MANFTQNAIKEALATLLEEKPLNKITVKNIVETCGINRNSFYYHYPDIPSLLIEMVNETADRVITKYPSIDSLEHGLEVSLDFVLEHKKMMEHIYNSVSRDLLETNLMKISEYVVRNYYNKLSEEYVLSEEEKELIIRFYKCECFGFIIDCINKGLSDNTKEECLKFFALHKNITDSILEKLPKK